MANKSKSAGSKRPPAPITSPKIKHLAGEALDRPSQMTTEQVRELGASIMAHIEPRKNNKKS